MHQIRFWLGLHPIPRWGSLQRSLYPLAGFPLRWGREGKMKRKGRGKGRRGKEGDKGSTIWEKLHKMVGYGPISSTCSSSDSGVLAAVYSVCVL